MRPITLLPGTIFGRLTILREGPPFGDNAAGQFRRRRWWCRCCCGHKVLIRQSHLRSGAIGSCGCLSRELHRRLRTTHGESCGTRRGGTAEYTAWSNMIQRCYNPRASHYANYGGRGITVCDEWRKSFLAFLSVVGRRPTVRHTLGRENNDGAYEPGNVQWETRTEQGRNRRNTLRLSINGVTLPLADWARSAGVRWATLYKRLRTYGWSAEKAVATPVRRESRCADAGKSALQEQADIHVQ